MWLDVGGYISPVRSLPVNGEVPGPDVTVLEHHINQPMTHNAEHNRDSWIRQRAAGGPHSGSRFVRYVHELSPDFPRYLSTVSDRNSHWNTVLPLHKPGFQVSTQIKTRTVTSREGRVYSMMMTLATISARG